MSKNIKSISEKKASSHYKVTGVSNSTKDVDSSSRTVTGMFNSYFFIDSDLDMLLPGCAKKSIQERGAGSKKGNKIKHLKDHDWSKVTARIDVLDERKVDFNGKQIEGIYHESFYPDVPESNDMLLKIQEGLYDDRSIGFMYMNIDVAERDSNEEGFRKNWETLYPKALNPDVADEYGYFYVVKEIKLFEGSDVAFGASSLTPMLGVKSGDKVALEQKLFEKLENMKSVMKSGNLTDEGFYKLEMEILQLKTCISEAFEAKPSVKDTFIEGREETDTKKKGNELLEFYKNLR